MNAPQRMSIQPAIFKIRFSDVFVVEVVFNLCLRPSFSLDWFIFLSQCCLKMRVRPKKVRKMKMKRAKARFPVVIIVEREDIIIF